MLEKGGHVIVETDVNLANNRDAPVLCMDHNNRGVARAVSEGKCGIREVFPLSFYNYRSI